MDRQLVSPLLIRPLQKPSKLSSATTYQHLLQFIPEIPLGPSRTQLERLTDALGVEIGAIAPSEGDRREEERRQEKARKIAEKRRLKEEARRLRDEAMLEDMLEEGGDGEYLAGEDGTGEMGMDGEMESGAVHMNGEEGMDDRGDVEYGDVVNDDEDEPDEDEEKGEKMEVDMGSEHAESSEEESESESEDEKCE